MESFECDVVVIGAGLSGLSAALYLLKKDRSLRIAVLEAKDRIGGRTFTRQLLSADGTKDFWDLGGEWVGRPQPHLQYLINKFHINTFTPVSPEGGQRVKEKSLSWQTYADLYQFTWKLKNLQRKLIGVDLRNSVNALEWDSIVFEAFKEGALWTQEAKKNVDVACKCMFGLAPSEMSLLYFLKYIESAGGLNIFVQPNEYTGGECRIKGGMQQLATHMVHRIGKKHVYLKQPVTEIIQSIEGAHVVAESGMQILCQRVVMAIPPHHAADISYQPPLPHVKLGLLQSVPIAFLVKFAVTYEEAFWTESTNGQRYGFQAVMIDDERGPVGIVYDASSGRGNPALAGFLSSAEGLATDPKSRQEFVLMLIEKHIGSRCRNLLEFSQMDWSKEPYNGGCFLKSLMPGTTRFFNSELRDPFDRVHFAGTETATVWCGFMNGAVQSGFRAATEVLYHLRPLVVSSLDPEEPKLRQRSPYNSLGIKSWMVWSMLGVGLISAILVLAKTKRLQTSGETIVKNIRLVFDQSVR